MAFVNVEKDPDAILDYSFDWTKWLAGDPGLSAPWTAPAGISKVNESFSAGVATVRLSGGTVGQQYDVLNRITKTTGEVDDRTLRVTIVQR